MYQYKRKQKKAQWRKSKMVMYITRHGQTDWNLEKKLQGRSDIPLNDTGREQAKECGRALEHAGIELIITSPLCRAEETGSIIRKWVGAVPLIREELLTERDFGIMNGTTADERDAENWPTSVGAEPIDQLNRRIWSAMEKFHHLYPGKTILAVTHGAALYSLLNQLSGGGLMIRPAQLKNGGISCIEYEDRPKLTMFNLSPGEYGALFISGRNY